VTADIDDPGSDLSNTVTLTPPAGAVLNPGSIITATDAVDSFPC
jgi:hypothetical protein